MKKFNLFVESIRVDRVALNEAKNSGKEFGIDIDGEVSSPIKKGTILIYKGVGSKSITIKDLFDNSYKIEESPETISINAGGAWRGILELNRDSATYDDSSADGIDHFITADMEEIGWHATEFNITYRELAEVLESRCDGILLCIEQEEPYQFSGLGFVYDLYDGKNKMYEFAQRKVKELLEEADEFEANFLEQDELQAAQFFKAL